MKTPERSVEEIGKDLHKILNNTVSRRLELSEYTKAVKLVQAMLQAERQRCDEMVEAERERILLAATKIISNPVEFMELTVFTLPNNPK